MVASENGVRCVCFSGYIAMQSVFLGAVKCLGGLKSDTMSVVFWHFVPMNDERLRVVVLTGVSRGNSRIPVDFSSVASRGADLFPETVCL